MTTQLEKETLYDTKLHSWTNDSCSIISDSVVRGFDETHFSKKSKLLKVCDFRGATGSDLGYYCSSIEIETSIYHYPFWSK